MPLLAPGILISHDSTGVTKGGKENKTRTKISIWKLEKEGKGKEKKKKTKIHPQNFCVHFFLI